MSGTNWIQLRGLPGDRLQRWRPSWGSSWLGSSKGSETSFPSSAPLERGIYRVSGIDAETGDELEAVPCGASHLQRFRIRKPHGASHDAAVAAAESREDPQHVLASRPEHGRQLHDQHELAGVQRGGAAQLPLPDGGAGRAQLPERRNGHGCRPCPDPGDPKQAVCGQRGRKRDATRPRPAWATSGWT